jgi:UDP-N-acetylglucosamine 1-carboxyvinyltransferase
MMYSMSQFIIEGGKPLAGTITVGGSKNAALPLLAASLLTEKSLELSNIPAILDVQHMVEILEAMGVHCERTGEKITVQASSVTADGLPDELVGRLRGSILLLGALLGRERYARLPYPGGDIIGVRPIDVHLDAFAQLGAHVVPNGEYIEIDGKDMKAGRVVLQEFSVTATENVLLAAARLPGKTTLHIAATEPHVVALAELLTQMGALIEGAGTHTITIEGKPELAGAVATTIDDMLEAGSFILLAAATHSEVAVERVPVPDLLLFFKKLSAIGVDHTIEGTTVTVRPSQLKNFKVQTLPHAGIPTDLQAPFSVLATQAHGSSLIHDPLYEGRFRHVVELQKMGASITVCDPHRVIIQGPTPLHGRHIQSLDLRAGAALLMAGLVAQGTTVIDEAEIIDRGYANLTQRLQALGATIKREG